MYAQKKESIDKAYNVSVGLRKTFKLGKKNAFDLRQQFQFSPRIQRLEYRVGDIFNEDGFWPIPDRRAIPNDDDDDDDDDDNDPPRSPSKNPDKELDDTPLEVNFNWRSNMAAQYNFQPFRWLRLSQGYILFYGEKEFRHTLRSDLDYRPVRHWHKKPKLEFALRGQLQYLGRERKGIFEWKRTVVPRADLIWVFKKEHQLVLSNSYNGEWEKHFFQFDRWRLGLNVSFSYQKAHRFSIGVQYQERMNSKKKKPIAGLGFSYEVRL